MSTARVALVTGAARGIGYACAGALAESGARVVLSDIDEEGVLASVKRLPEWASLSIFGVRMCASSAP